MTSPQEFIKLSEHMPFADLGPHTCFRECFIRSISNPPGCSLAPLGYFPVWKSTVWQHHPSGAPQISSLWSVPIFILPKVLSWKSSTCSMILELWTHIAFLIQKLVLSRSYKNKFKFAKLWFDFSSLASKADLSQALLTCFEYHKIHAAWNFFFRN